MVAGAKLGWTAVVVIAGLLGVDAIVRGRVRPLLAIAVAVAVIGWVRVDGRTEAESPAWVGTAQALIGTVAGSPTANGRTQQVVLRAAPADDASAAPARICVTGPVTPSLARGDRIAVSGAVRGSDQVSANTAGFLRYRACAGSIFVERFTVLEQGGGIRNGLDRLRLRLTEGLLTAVPGDRGALLAGLATGDDASLTVGQRDAFIITGTSHVTAVSGSNLALLLAVVLVVGGRLGSTRSLGRFVLVVAVVWAYIALVGGSPPAVRAGVVATLALAGQRLGRRPDFLTLAVVAASVELLVRPRDLQSIAFQLSVISAISLVLGLGGRSPRGVWGWLKHGAYATAVTQAATAAVLVPAFGRVPLYAIPANVVVGPLCAAAFPLAILTGAASLASDTLAATIGWPAGIVAAVVLASVRAFAHLPFATAGTSVTSWLPPWAWALLGLTVIAALSGDVQGGIRRRATEIRRMDRWDRLAWQLAMGGAACGALAAFVLR